MIRRPVRKQRVQNRRDDLADETLVPVVLVTRGVISAIAVARFIDFRSFHDIGDSRVCQQ